MKIFEFHFNPPFRQGSGIKSKIEPDLIFDTFCYEPTNIYERRLGSLYMAGELKNVLPKNLRFLDVLAEIIKKEYYSQFRLNAEKSLKETLKKANEHLEKIAKSGDVSWLGNLSFSILTISPQKNWLELNFTKTGNLKILLLRGNRITDISKNLEIQGIEPYPLKIFINIVSGKLSLTDKIIILSNEIYNFLSTTDLLKEIAKIPIIDEKKLREILKIKEKELSQMSGFLFLCDSGLPKIEERYPLSALSLKQLPEKKPIVFRKEVEKFSWKEVFSPLMNFLKKSIKLLNQVFKNLLNIFRIKCFFEKIISSFKKLFSFPQKIKIAAKPRKITLPDKSKLLYLVKHRNTILILIFIIFLILGTFIFQKEKEFQLKEIESKLNKIEEKVAMAEGFLILKETNLEALKQANLLFKEAWDEVLILTKIESSLKDEAILLKNSIETQLFNLNKLEVISEPQLFFEFSAEEFLPQKMVFLEGNLYLFSPFSQNIVRISTTDKERKNYSPPLDKGSGVNLAATLSNSILFFSKPKKISILEGDNFIENFDLKEPYSDFDFSNLSTYKGNLYLLDSKSGEIIKYSAPLDKGKDNPKLWLDPKTPHQEKLLGEQIKSMAMDGSIWLLTKEDTIEQYSVGEFQKTLSLNFFPYPKNFSQIFTSPNLSYLYILEPAQNRVIIINKTGNIIKQFQSEKFDNLKYLAVSSDGKTIYLLNGVQIYQIKF